ncbi:MAG TPA: sulfite exporter TauE/SafE family protein, partial [Gemmatimonadaceae bacterium]|nr:sulfite exporter TauE/SafE family protein [Gemmatimonadaceae bacterium]
MAAVAIPHAVATALRCWRLRRSVDWSVLRTFGILSAAGALVGALLYTRFSSHVLTVILGALLIATAVAGLTDWARRWHPDGALASAFGFASGLFGGLAGNQGGLHAGLPLARGRFAGRLPVANRWHRLESS